LKKWGLALGGGGILGFAHLGVLEVMEEHGLKPDFLAGTSAGAVVAGLYACGIRLRKIRTEIMKMSKRDDLFDPVASREDDRIASLALSGLIQGSVIENALDRILKGRRIDDVDTPLSITSVDVSTGDIVIFTNRRPTHQARALPGRTYLGGVKVSEAIRASISVPGIFVPKDMGQRVLVDGGVRDMVPAFEVRRLGAEEVVAVDLGLHVEEPVQVTNVYSILMRSFALSVRDSVVEHLKSYASLVIQPDVKDIGFPTPAKLKELIDKGKECAEENMGRWLAIVS